MVAGYKRERDSSDSSVVAHCHPSANDGVHDVGARLNDSHVIEAQEKGGGALPPKCPHEEQATASLLTLACAPASERDPTLLSPGASFSDGKVQGGFLVPAASEAARSGVHVTDATIASSNGSAVSSHAPAAVTNAAASQCAHGCAEPMSAAMQPACSPLNSEPLGSSMKAPALSVAAPPATSSVVTGPSHPAWPHPHSQQHPTHAAAPPPTNHYPYYSCAQHSTMPPQQLHPAAQPTPQPMDAAHLAPSHQAPSPHQPQQQPAVYHSALQPPLPNGLQQTSVPIVPNPFAQPQQTVSQLPQTPASLPGCTPTPFQALGAFTSTPASFPPCNPIHPQIAASRANQPSTIQVTMQRAPSLEECADEGEGEGGDCSDPATKKLKHNVAERRRTSRLNALFEELASVLACRPDLFIDSGFRHGKADVLLSSIGCIRHLHQYIDMLQIKLSAAHVPPQPAPYVPLTNQPAAPPQPQPEYAWQHQQQLLHQQAFLQPP